MSTVQRFFPHPTTRSVAAVLVLVAMVAVPLVSPPGSVGAQGLPPYTLEVTPTSGLVDGQPIDIVLRAAPGRTFGVVGTVRICRDGPTYTSEADLHPYSGGNCPNKPVSTSGSEPWPIRRLRDGSAMLTSVRAGTGAVSWGPAEDPERFSLTCDVANPCRLVLNFSVDGVGQIVDSSTLLTYAEESPIAACGGLAAGSLSAGGPDRLLQSWVTWTQQQCQTSGVGASTLAVFSGEGDGHRAFASGLTDITYSAVGASFPDTEGASGLNRNSVSIPIALNAVVIGVLGGYPTNDPAWPEGVPHPYEDVRLTVAEAATLLGKGTFAFELEHLDALQARNHELARLFQLSNNGQPNPQATATADSTVWMASRLFVERAPQSWRTSPLNITGNPPNVPRGVVTSMTTADPPFSSALFETFSALANLKKLVADNEFKPQNWGPIWVLTDLATAEQLRIPTVAIENAAGEFVRPTPDTLRAAVPTMERQPDGTYVPSASTARSGAYPLSFVEHLVAPVEPLLDADCAPRPGSQQLLTDWASYLVGPGQQALAAGLVPLTPELVASAQASRSEIATAAVTGQCAGGDPEDLGGGAPGGPTGSGLDLPQLPAGLIPFGDLGFGGAPTGGFGGDGLGLSGLPGEGSLLGDGENDERTSADRAPDELNAVVASAALPELASGPGRSPVASAVTLLGLALLGGLAGTLSRGRPRRSDGGVVRP